MKNFWNTLFVVAVVAVFAFLANLIAFPSFVFTLVVLSLIWVTIVLIVFLQFDIVRLNGAINYHGEALEIIRSVDTSDLNDWDRYQREIHDHEIKNLKSWNSRIRMRARESLARQKAKEAEIHDFGVRWGFTE